MNRIAHFEFILVTLLVVVMVFVGGCSGKGEVLSKSQQEESLEEKADRVYNGMFDGTSSPKEVLAVHRELAQAFRAGDVPDLYATSARLEQVTTYFNTHPVTSSQEVANLDFIWLAFLERQQALKSSLLNCSLSSASSIDATGKVVITPVQSVC